MDEKNKGETVLSVINLNTGCVPFFPAIYQRYRKLAKERPVSFFPAEKEKVKRSSSLVILIFQCIV